MEEGTTQTDKKLDEMVVEAPFGTITVVFGKMMSFEVKHAELCRSYTGTFDIPVKLKNDRFLKALKEAELEWASEEALVLAVGVSAYELMVVKEGEEKIVSLMSNPVVSDAAKGGAIGATIGGGVALATQGAVAASIPAYTSATATVVSGVGSIMAPSLPYVQGFAYASLGSCALPVAVATGVGVASYYGYKAYSKKE